MPIRRWSRLHPPIFEPDWWPNKFRSPLSSSETTAGVIYRTPNDPEVSWLGLGNWVNPGSIKVFCQSSRTLLGRCEYRLFSLYHSMYRSRSASILESFKTFGWAILNVKVRRKSDKCNTRQELFWRLPEKLHFYVDMSQAKARIIYMNTCFSRLLGCVIVRCLVNDAPHVQIRWLCWPVVLWYEGFPPLVGHTFP